MKKRNLSANASDAMQKKEFSQKKSLMLFLSFQTSLMLGQEKQHDALNFRCTLLSISNGCFSSFIRPFSISIFLDCEQQHRNLSFSGYLKSGSLGASYSDDGLGHFKILKLVFINNQLLLF